MTRSANTFFIAVLFQVLVIVGIIIFKLSVIAGGTEVILRIEPVDPRDLLRGDYVTFQYTISSIDAYYVRGEPPRNGDTVYVVLRQSGLYGRLSHVETRKPAGEELFIKGTVVSGGAEEVDEMDDPGSSFRFRARPLRIKYGIEEYFILEGTGHGLDFRNRDATARVAIDADGNAVLRQIYLDQVPWP